MAWLAQLQTEDLNLPAREAARRQLRLHVAAIAGPNAARVLVHNISSTGLLIECDADTTLPETFEVELPEQGLTLARVVWHSDNFYGCEFEKPVATRVISAAQLRSPPESRVEVAIPPVLHSLPSDADDHLAYQQGDQSGLSPRAKLAIIVGSAGSLWAMIFLGIALIG